VVLAEGETKDLRNVSDIQINLQIVVKKLLKISGLAKNSVNAYGGGYERTR
jgi:hypothetical protein